MSKLNGGTTYNQTIITKINNSMYNKPYLQPYKNMNTRHQCPSCGAKNSFTLYLDGNTNLPINSKVGRCERESKCGYHYTPKQFFLDNPSENSDQKEWKSHLSKSIDPPKPIGFLPFEFVENSVSFKSNFISFLCEFLTNQQVSRIIENYAIGATKSKEVIFWQIDFMGKVRTGKIMQYNPITGKRIKHESGAIDWVHNKLKKTGKLDSEFNLKQCFFGEHLLNLYPNPTVAIVESEKSALIASIVMPDFIWLAAGNLNGLGVEKCKVLNGRKVVFYPDLGAFDKWQLKAIEIEKLCNCTIAVSRLLEDKATDLDRDKGLDIADYIIDQLQNNSTFEIQNRFSPELQYMLYQNAALAILIEKLELEELIRSN